MGRHIGITGPRKLTDAQESWLWKNIEVATLHDYLHVGDAPGVDRLAKSRSRNASLIEYKTEGRERWHYQARSKRMVEGLRDNLGTLWAYPNKPEPEGITRDSWKGSGTWGTIRYAQALGVKVVIVPLPDVHEWWELTEMEPRKLTTGPLADAERVEQLALW